jgi:ribosomal 30S subunit maturation factor RimM
LTWVKDRFSRLGEVWISHPSGVQKRAIRSARRAGEEWLLLLEGIDSPEAAKPWHGAYLLVSDADVVRPAGGWIAADLPAMRVLDEEGNHLGQGSALEELPAGEAILCVALDGQKVFLPMDGDFKCVVDPVAKTITVNRGFWDVLQV